MKSYNELLTRLQRLFEREIFGTFKPDEETIAIGETSPEAYLECVEKVICEWTEIIDELLDQQEKYSDEWGKLLDSRGVTFAEYSLLFDASIPAEEYEHYRAFQFFHILDDIQKRQFISGITNDLEDYFETLLQRDMGILDFFLRGKVGAYFSLETMKSHTHIVAAPGTGKSQLIKLMMYRLQKMSQKKRDKSIILIEPAGDLTKETLFFALNREHDRVIYIDPYINELVGTEEQYIPVVNPFYLSEKNDKSINRLVDELTAAFVEIVEASELTPNMKSLFKSCLRVLLSMTENPSLKDLYDFVGEDEKGHFVQLGLRHPDSVVKGFFQRDFFSANYKTTRGSVRAKIHSIIISPVFRYMIDGKNTVDFEKAMNSGKVVLINLSKGDLGQETSLALGRLILANIQAIAKKRVKIPIEFRKPVYVFIDECQNYICPTVHEILAESRKFGVHLVLAHQVLKQLGSSLREIITGNTMLKIFGVSASGDTVETLAEQIGFKKEAFQTLEKHQFFVKDIHRNQPTFKIVNPLTLADTQNPYFYLPYEEVEANKGYKRRVLSSEQKALLWWMIKDSGYYKKMPTMSENEPVGEEPGLLKKAEQSFIPKYDL